MANRNGHGGRRPGAGRPKGSRSRLGEKLSEKILGQGKCPVDALIRLAEAAERDGDRAQAIAAWKSVLAYVYPKPKAVEVDPDTVVELAQLIAEARSEARETPRETSYTELLRQSVEALEDLQG